MFAAIDINKASAQSWDVIIVGSSFAAMFFLHGLGKDKRVLLVEKGSVVNHAELPATPGAHQEQINQTNTSGEPKDWIANTLFGGNSNYWWGQASRLHPHDFELFTRYGVGQDWPLGYDDLESYYGQAETLMEVAGGGNEAVLPRSAPYPFPAHQPSRSDIAMRDADPLNWLPVPTARSNGGSRPKCCANGVCTKCPIDAKFTVLNSVNRFTRPNAFLLTGTEARVVDINNGVAKGIKVRSQDGSEHRISAGLVALGANALFNAAILLRSGLQNRHLGHYLHEQKSLLVELDINAANYFGGSSITGHGYALYAGEHRKTSAAVLLENFNSPVAVRPEKNRWTERLRLKLIAEDMPRYENTVQLDANGEPEINWVGHSPYAAAGLKRAENMLAAVLPFRVERTANRLTTTTEAQMQGTHRMGTAAEDSVVDAKLRCHQVSNVLALGAGAFPTCSPANPTLTLAALALRAGVEL